MTKQQDSQVVKETSPLSDDMLDQAEGGGMSTSFSSPSLNTLGLEDDSDSGEHVFMTNQLRNDEERVLGVTNNFRSREPGKLSLRVSPVTVVLVHSVKYRSLLVAF